MNHRSACPEILLALLALALCALAPVARAADELPSDSVYRMSVATVDQDGQASRFERLRGDVRIVSMFYTSCPYVCPMIVETVRRVEAGVGPERRAKLKVALVSLDPERDDVATLKKTAKDRRIDETRWRLLRADAADVRRLAAVLGIQYRQLEDREFNHSSALVLLDRDGRVLARSSTIGTPDPEFVKAVARALD